MFTLRKIIFVVALFAVAMAQAPEPPLNDTRLSIHTLLREDIFAGFLTNDLARLSRAEKNIASLLEQRPQAKAELLAWQGGATLYRAVLAHEQKQPQEFQQKYQAALALFAEAKKLSPKNPGVNATTGGSLETFADRLPKENRAAAWAMAYENFQVLWQQQGETIAGFPTHHKGEVLGGLAQAAQRTGRKDEMNLYLDKILVLLKDTPYEKPALAWKQNPAAANNSILTCMNCHEPGRLAARVAKLNAQ